MRRNGVAFIANMNVSKCIESYKAINNRIMTIRVRGKPMNITIFQIYAPTADKSEAGVEKFYEVQTVLNETPKKRHHIHHGRL